MYLTSLAIKEMQIASALRFYLTLLRMAHHKNQWQQTMVRVWEKKNSLVFVGGIANTCVVTMETRMEFLQKISNKAM